MNALDEWLVAAGAEVGLTREDVQSKLVLDLARDVAHGVLRPAAPLTTYLLGIAVGRGADPADAAARLSALAATWVRAEADHGDGGRERAGSDGGL